MSAKNPLDLGHIDAPPHDDWIKNVIHDDDEVAKSGVVSPAFGSKSKRRNQLVSRLKGRRKYDPPVRGGKRKRKGHMGGNIVKPKD